MQKLIQHDKQKAIDMLNERLAFERAGVQLYDRLLMQMRAVNDPEMMRTYEDLDVHRNEEKEHEEWLEAQIRSLGGDAHAQTEHSELITKESKGIIEVVNSDPSISHLFHAMLAAELVDNAGWDLLVQVASDAGDREARREFKKRLHEEEDHLLLIRRCVERFAAHEVLGAKLKLPSHEMGIGSLLP